MKKGLLILSIFISACSSKFPECIALNDTQGSLISKCGTPTSIETNSFKSAIVYKVSCSEKYLICLDFDTVKSYSKVERYENINDKIDQCLR